MHISDRVSPSERLIGSVDRALRTLTGVVPGARATPGRSLAEATLDDADRTHAAALMRVNHTGEVCAQALYSAQALLARDPSLRARLDAAAREETDHLAWTAERIAALGGRPSLLNPLWYAGSFAIGIAAGLGGERRNLGFVVETERQVEEHLTSHLDSLPAADARSRAVVEAMAAEEARHGAMAEEAGALPLPRPVRRLMRACADVMRAVAYRV